MPMFGLNQGHAVLGKIWSAVEVAQHDQVDRVRP